MAAANLTSSRSSESLVGEAMTAPRRRRTAPAFFALWPAIVIPEQGGFA